MTDVTVEKLDGFHVRITVDGVTRPACEWAYIFDVKVHTIRNRILRGRTGMEIFAPTKMRWGTSYMEVEFEGDIFWVDLRKFAKRSGLPEKKIRDRLTNGWTLEEAVDPEGGTKRRWESSKTRVQRPLTYQGKTQSMGAWARELGIKRVTIRERLRHGWSVEKTLSTKVNSTRLKSFLVWEGRKLPLVQWAKLKGINPLTIRYRLRAGWSVEEALSTPTAGKGRGPITFQDVTDTAKGWDRRLNLTLGTTSERLRRGWSIERACSSPRKTDG